MQLIIKNNPWNSRYINILAWSLGHKINTAVGFSITSSASGSAEKISVLNCSVARCAVRINW